MDDPPATTSPTASCTANSTNGSTVSTSTLPAPASFVFAVVGFLLTRAPSAHPEVAACHVCHSGTLRTHPSVTRVE